MRGRVRLHRTEGEWLRFPSREAKLHYMQERADEDATHPLVVAAAAPFCTLPRPEREAAILRFCQQGITFVPDPVVVDDDTGDVHHIQILDAAPVALERGWGKCTAKASLYDALCNASGVPCRLSPVFRGRYEFPHVRNRVQGPDGRWRVADPSVLNSTIGRLPRHPITNLGAH